MPRTFGHGNRDPGRSAGRTEEEIREWIDLAPAAQQVLLDQLDSDDNRVGFRAAAHMLDRAPEKVSLKVEQRVEHGGTLTSLESQCVLSLIAAHGLAYTKAEPYGLLLLRRLRRMALNRALQLLEHRLSCLLLDRGAGDVSAGGEGPQGASAVDLHHRVPVHYATPECPRDQGSRVGVVVRAPQADANSHRHLHAFTSGCPCWGAAGVVTQHWRTHEGSATGHWRISSIL